MNLQHGNSGLTLIGSSMLILWFVRYFITTYLWRFSAQLISNWNNLTYQQWFPFCLSGYVSEPSQRSSSVVQPIALQQSHISMLWEEKTWLLLWSQWVLTPHFSISDSYVTTKRKLDSQVYPVLYTDCEEVKLWLLCRWELIQHCVTKGLQFTGMWTRDNSEQGLCPVLTHYRHSLQILPQY